MSTNNLLDSSANNSPKLTRRSVRFGLGISVRLGMLFLLLLLLFAAGSYWFTQVFAPNRESSDSARLQTASAGRDAARLQLILDSISATAVDLATLSQDTLRDSMLASVLPGLVTNHPSAQIIDAFGYYPAPETGVQPAVWRKSGTAFAAADAGNYAQQPWFTAAAYGRNLKPYWSAAHPEGPQRRTVVTCVVPVRSGATVAGVFAISVGVTELAAAWEAQIGDRDSYALLLDMHNHIFAGTSAAAARFSLNPKGVGLASISKDFPALAPIAVAETEHQQDLVSGITKLSAFDPKQISSLKDQSKNLSREQAEQILALFWRKASSAPPTIVESSVIDDPIFKADATASVVPIAAGALRILWVGRNNTQVSQLYQIQQLATLAGVALILLLSLFFVHLRITAPLRRIVRTLAAPTTVEDLLKTPLDDHNNDEVGEVARWHNEQIRVLYDTLVIARANRVQANQESKERRGIQEQLEQSQEWLRAALKSVHDGVVVTDALGYVDDINPAAEEILGVAAHHCKGKLLEDVLRMRLDNGQAQAGSLINMVAERGGRVDYDKGVSIETPTVAALPIVLSAQAMRSKNTLLGTLITFSRRRGEDKLSDEQSASVGASNYQAKDPITGLPTRAACERLITSVVDQTHLQNVEGAVLFFDLDHFKRVNDSGGQQAGDDVLVRIAETLGAAINSPDAVFRLASDQFAVVLNMGGASAAKEQAEALRARIAATRFYWESRHFGVTCSVGICPINRDCATAQEVIRRADDACAAAKRNGRNSVAEYEQSMDRVGRLTDDDVWLRCIQRGLDEDLFHLRSQWVLPGHNYAAEGRVFEILLALEDDEGFWAAPAAFQGVADRHYLSTSIDRWVLKQTLHQLEQEPSSKRIAFCSINLTSQTIADLGYLDFLVAQLESRPQLASKLCFELRELAISEHPQEAAAFCTTLNSLGCKIAIDHYIGRSMHSLNLLRRFTVDFVKVDALAFRNLSNDPIEALLAESTLRIARTLRRRTMVYNIEDNRQIEQWRQLGADYFQGFGVAKPSPLVFMAPD